MVSLMAGSCNLRVSSILESKAGNGSLIGDLDDDIRMDTSIAILTSLTLCVGLIQVMGPNI